MRFHLRSLPVILWISACLGGLSAQPVEPGHFVFVFHRDKDVVEVFDGPSLTRLAAPRVDFGAFRAFGLPGSNDTGAAAKFYVLTPHAVHVLDGSFHPTATISLTLSALPGRGGAALSSDGKTLLVAGAQGVYLIDTATDAVAIYLPAGFEVAGVALSSDPTRAYVAAAGTPLLRAIDLDARRILDETTISPVELESWDRSPNGLRALGLAESAFYRIGASDLAPFEGAVEPLLRAADEKSRRILQASSDAGAEPALKRRLEATNSGFVYVEDAGRLWRESLLGGPAAIVTDSRTQSEVHLAAGGGWDVSPAGEAVYVANGAGELARLPVDPAVSVRTAELLGAGGEVEAVTPRVEQAGQLTLVTANNLVVAGGTRFQLTVKAVGANGAAESGVPVFISNRFPAAAPANCVTAITAANGEAVMDCTMGEVTAPTPIQLTISDTRGRSAPIVHIQAVIPTEFDGLALIEGDNQRVPPDIQFQIVVQASRRRVPLVGEALNMETTPRNVLDCPRTVVTDAQGRATFLCRSPIEAEEAESVTFTIRDNAGNVATGTIIVDPEAIAPTGLTKIEGDGQLVPQGNAEIHLAVSSFRDGQPRANTTLNITVIDPGTPPAVICPTNARTNAEGIGRFTCRTGTIFGARKSVQIQVSDFGVTLAEPFTVIVTESSVGFARKIEFDTSEDLRLPAGRPVLNAIQVKALTEDDQPVPNATVYFFPMSPGQITIDPPSVQTNSEGVASTTVTIGCNTSPVIVGVGFNPDQMFADLQVRPLAGQFGQMTIIQGDGQSGAPGQPLNAQALVAQTSDACGAPLTQQQVTWRVKPAFAATLRSVVSRSDARGRVSALVTLGQYGGPFEVEVGAGEIFTTFRLAVNLPASELRAVSGSGQTVGAGQVAEQPLVVQALGSNGFGVTDVPVQWSIAEGPGTITQSQAATGGAGIAYARVRVAGPGTPRVRVQASALGQTVSFLLNSADGPQAPANGFVNGASFQSGWTRGAAGSIFGVALADQLVSASSVPFPTTLAGVTVRLNGTPVPLIFVSPGQINLQVPFDAALGEAAVEIDNNGKKLTVSGVQINGAQPGVFELDLEGKRIVAALHQDFTLISPSSPAIPGEVVQLFFTGAGVTTPTVPTNTPGPSNPLAETRPVTVKIGGVNQEVFGSFYAPTLVTANQVNFRLAADTPAGDRELLLEIEGVGSPAAILPVKTP